MFHLSFSNRFEILLDTLLGRLGAEQPGPFGQRQVVVPSSALRRKVELAVADREGVCANLRFDYLAQWLWQQIGRVAAVPERSPFAAGLLAWRIHGLLDQAHERGAWIAGHPRLARYLGQADARMCFELAGRIAAVFDHYLTYRPRWLEIWASGRGSVLEAGASAADREDEAWQAELWRRIRDGMALRQEHPAQVFLRRVTAMPADELAAAGLPGSVHVFGLPALPPLYLDMLRELSRVVEVRLYVLNPCREFWFDIVDARRLSWLAARQQDMFFETGNGLLAAWGKQTRAHIGLLFEGEHAVEEEAAFAEHPGHHLLARLQNAILDLQELEPASIRLAAGDRSIEVQVCHSRTRELEVLQDRLLGLFKAAASEPDALRPSDIVVLMPDLEGAAPLIEAVFGTAPRARRIPWRITGLGGTHDNPVARVLDQALQLAAGRFPASRVFDLLRQAPVAAHFGLGEEALETIHDWMREAGMRWGLDAGEVAGAGQAQPAGHTLEAGLHRLFLAWAAGDAARQATFAGHIGAAAPEGQAAFALGGFWRYVDSLRILRDALRRTHTGEGWRQVLHAVLERLVGDSAGLADALREVRAAIAALADDIAAAGLDAELPLDVVHPALAARLDDPARGGVPGGTVTFSALSALRGLPYRVVCLIGLDQGAFPGGERPAEFDLMSARPQAGDRQRRLDDRNLFLDLILSARDVLHLSYVGRSVRDGSALPPSVLVDELLDTLASACATEPGNPQALAQARERLVLRHPLQAFAGEYFLARDRGDARLASFNEDYADALASRLGAAARHAADADAAEHALQCGEAGVLDGGEDAADDGDAAPAAGAAPFFAAPLPPPDAAWREMDLLQLVRFFANPGRYLLRDRLGLDLPEAEAQLDDVEPMLPDWPAGQALARRLLPVLLEQAGVAGAHAADGEGPDAGGGEDAPAGEDALWALARAGGEYPAGTLGDSALERELGKLRAFARRQRQIQAGLPLPPYRAHFETRLDGEAWSLSAVFADLRPGGLLRARYDDTRAADYLGAWLAHLLLCADPVPGLAPETRGLSRDGEFALRPLQPGQARAQLQSLLALYREGLSRPLHFFPRSAWAYMRNGESAGKALARWTGGNRPEFGEGNDPAWRLALRGELGLPDERFFELARGVLRPLLDHLDDPRPG
ncbi:exodeoxyribonuclease V subunit gamma [Thauera linaloolentis]|uniref:RecBCD enzyme subunit RecC n=1 Tax=Thauera linaloolentis (strain DSM 12138 / JCM 21573 / CCUG 41526 / CIP 105981 / IAM 15112 / NBRC 102519 / 47Lol) TaxID=1123367 RepID=N6YYJ4_THAL4|nr:exodeoxyribonuclease V subunit gamma [Thauera linaloolentis]ENO87437.1 exodeoxyribonuclease V subunit gamma [Thauera linaloolentis 47Lol = DSM 12138]MCM8565087.1 exodeoxyribonuclease V subunit gamma [Thauera linaloolentis]